MARMSVSMTLDAVRDRSKTVTRRHVDTWQTLKAGDRLTLIEKGMGLPKGAKQVVVADAEVLDVRVEPLALVDHAECIAEGFPDMEPDEFVAFWFAGHGYSTQVGAAHHADPGTIEVRRIEFAYWDTYALRCTTCGKVAAILSIRDCDSGGQTLIGMVADGRVAAELVPPGEDPPEVPSDLLACLCPTPIAGR